MRELNSRKEEKHTLTEDPVSSSGKQGGSPEKTCFFRHVTSLESKRDTLLKRRLAFGVVRRSQQAKQACSISAQNATEAKMHFLLQILRCKSQRSMIYLLTVNDLAVCETPIPFRERTGKSDMSEFFATSDPTKISKTCRTIENSCEHLQNYNHPININ